MIDSIYLAWQYIKYNSVKSIILILCISLIAYLPIALNQILNESEIQLLSRANSTPLIIGAKGNKIDVTMNSIYFSRENTEMVTMQAMDRIAESGLALPIPMHIKFQMQEYPIVGTSIDYFDFRNLSVAKGRLFGLLGECVIGFDVAKKLKLNIGDEVISTPQNLFNLAGIYPLKLKIVGILENNAPADNEAIFVDLKTAWIIEGLGHGHQEVQQDPNLTDDTQAANAIVTVKRKLNHFNVIDSQNLDTFHFHGDMADFPLSSVIVQPVDIKSATILRGRYLDSDSQLQAIKPVEVIEGLLNTIVQVKNYIDMVIMIVAVATVFAVILIVSLSLRLRQKEFETINHIGCSQNTIFSLICAELFLIAIASVFVCAIGYLLLQFYLNDLVKLLFIN